MKKRKPKSRPKKKKVGLLWLDPQELANMMMKAVEHALNSHPGIPPRINHGVEDQPIGRYAGSMEYGVRLKRKPNFLHVLGALAIPVVLAVLVQVVRSYGAPDAAIYRIRNGYQLFGYDYTRSKPQLLDGHCVFWTDMDGRGNIFCGRFEISEVPGRIPLPVPTEPEKK